MKIGTLISFNKDTDVKAKLQQIKDNNMNCCQLCCWDMSLYTDENAAIINEAVAETGVEIAALWAGWSGPKEWNFIQGPFTLGIVPQAYRFQRTQELMMGSDFAEKIHVNMVATHVGFIPENPSDPDFMGTVVALRYLTNYMKAKNQYFLFETGQETPVTMLRCIEAIGNENVGINLDTANLILYGKANPVDAMDVFGKYVMNTHCKDGLFPTNGTELGREVPLGEGKANFPEVYRKLMALNYDGPFIIEREISGDKQLEDIRNARDFIRSCAE